MKSFLIPSFIFLFTSFAIAQVGIGTTIPNGALDITSATDGLLIPRVALTSTAAVLPVITGTTSELVYNTASINDVTPGFYYLSTATGPWVPLGGAAPSWEITGNANIVDGTNFLGTTNGVDVAFRRNNAAAGKLGATNTSFGVGALTNGAATNSTAIGNNALSASTGYDNTAMGYQAMDANVGGFENTAFGKDALGGQTSGAANTAVGHSALVNSNGTNNVTALGFQAGSSNTASNATLLGFQAGSNNSGDRFVAVGFQAGSNNAAGDNIAIGTNTMSGLSSGASGRNVAIGTRAINASTGATVSQNVAIGYQAGLSIQSINNVAIGNEALLQSSGENNTAVGANAMTQGNTQFNTALGSSALFNASGNSNVALGFQAGQFNGTGNNSVIIGYQANAQNLTNAISIGYQASASASNQIQMGNGLITSARVNVGWTVTSDKRYKFDIKNSSLGLDFIKSLRPVSYIRKNDDSKKTEYGFIAQEIEQALIDVGDANNGIISKDDAGMYGVRYNDFIPMTVKAIQEQQMLIEKLQKDNAELKAVNAAILKRLEAIENRK